ncbi:MULTISPECIES: hypothetical protein [Pseudomonas syringae group]|uniref:hypothetical protein n=1 Tax=Pseudomonas syringae group TaxID=136849 RepID=UPI000F3C5D1B|nr:MULTISPECIES: hypothetical protein [Pseudomonas syringae group]RMS73416.1 hypothetical protein ALP61_00583 [Pseudomonas savastanoi]
MPLPTTPKHEATLRLLRHGHTALADLSVAIDNAFDVSACENPELARLILDELCLRLIAGDATARPALIAQIKHFGTLKCLSPSLVCAFTSAVSDFRLDNSQAIQDHAMPATFERSNDA